jgi:hypothetical protein
MLSADMSVRPELTADEPVRSVRRLFVIWQNPTTRAPVRVGFLRVDQRGGYEFRYLERAATALGEGFRPLAAFPDLNRRYRSTDLPAFFANRVMSASRPDYPSLVEALDLSVDASPVEILARTGGPRATDTFQIAAEPTISPDDVATSLFLVSGVRHIDGAEERIRKLRPGDALTVRPEPANPVNPLALLLDSVPNEPVGWIPDWMADYVQDLLHFRADPRVSVVRVNPPGRPAHLRLLCRLEVQLPVGYRPFAE